MQTQRLQMGFVRARVVNLLENWKFQMHTAFLPQKTQI